MPHLPHVIGEIIAVGSQTTPFITSTHDLAMSPVASQAHIPLAQRTAAQLLDSANALRHMATTATTADVMQALLTLADRYAALAEERRNKP